MASGFLALVSRVTGMLVRIRKPGFLASAAAKAFRSAYRIDLSDAIVPEEGFSTISDLFARALVPGARTFDADTILGSPVDGALRAVECNFRGELEVKGQRYTAAELVGGGAFAERLQNGWAFNFYLSPPDYHRVHFPLSGKVVGSRYIPGSLWPVNNWALAHVPKLFCSNERLVTFLETDLGLVAVVMVGALNVGRIEARYDDWLTNTGRLPSTFERAYEPSIPVRAGAELGVFHMGSAVVILTERQESVRVCGAPVSKIRAGERVRVGSRIL